MSLAWLGSAHSVWAVLGLPPLTACVVSRSTLLRLQVVLCGNCLKRALGPVHFPGLSHSGSCSWILHKGTDSVGLAFCALPRSEQLRQLGAWQAHSPRRTVHLITSPAPAPRFPGCAARVPPQVCRVSPLGSWSLTETFPADVNSPVSQEDLVSNWEPAHNLVEDAVSAAEIAPHLLALAVACLPLCLQQEEGPACSQLALPWYSLNPLFCERARLCLRAFHGKVLSLSLFFPSPWLSHSLGCCLTLAPSDCPQDFQVWSLP